MTVVTIVIERLDPGNTERAQTSEADAGDHMGASSAT